ncbi:MAG TPA: hypothetical protein VNL69_09835 [Bacteroidota bacterium]|nr:hypothetical protein [Bacteroidota bacterium]
MPVVPLNIVHAIDFRSDGEDGIGEGRLQCFVQHRLLWRIVRNQLRISHANAVERVNNTAEKPKRKTAIRKEMNQ